MVTQKSLPQGHAVLLAGLLFCFCLPGLAQSHMTVRHDVHHDVSAPLSEMILQAPPPSLEKHEAEPVRRIPLPPGLSQLEEDPVRQRTMVPFTPVVGTSFEGLGQGQYGFSVTGAPPDTNGTVGATQYVQWVNTSFAIFNKTNGALIAGPTAGNTLWSGFGGGSDARLYSFGVALIPDDRARRERKQHHHGREFGWVQFGDHAECFRPA